MTNTILVIGNFGYATNQLDGQTIKTRNIYKSLCGKTDECDFFDVSQYSYIYSFFHIMVKVKNFNQVIFLPGIKLLYLLAFLFLICKPIFRFKAHYIVVGGWLPGLLRKNLLLRYAINKFDSVSFELPSMQLKANEFIYNTDVLTNFRHDVRPSVVIEYSVKDTLKLVYFSRVMKDKGVFEALELIKKLHEDKLNISLDIYGPLNFKEEAEFSCFYNMIDELDGIVEYKGILVPEAIINVLSQYEVLLFPTFYDGEGFPGAIVDSIFSGLYTISSDWKYNKEIIQEYSCGEVCSEGFIPEAYDLIVSFLQDRERLNHLRCKTQNSHSSFTEIAFIEWYYRNVENQTR